MRFPNNQKIRQGSSMIEVVIATLLSGVVVVGALNVMGGAIKTRTVIATVREGPALADELLAKIMSLSFDDIDDYANWSASPPVDSNDVPMLQYTGWTRQAAWNKARRDNGGWWFMKTGLKRIRVTVTAPDGTVTVRSGYRWKEGALEQPSAIDTEIVTWVGAELQIGAQGMARAGTNHINTPTD